MGRGLGEHQRAILLTLHDARQDYPSMPRRELRARLDPAHETMSGARRVTLHRAIKSLESRGLIDVVKAREWQGKTGILFRQSCDDLELTPLGIHTARRIRARMEMKTTEVHISLDELTAKFGDPDFLEESEEYGQRAAKRACGRLALRRILEDRRAAIESADTPSQSE